MTAPNQNIPVTLLNQLARVSTILVVDDEALVLDVVRRSLTHAGFSVMTASEGHEGMDVYLRNRSRISAILLDVNMPGMNGLEMWRELRAFDPEIPVVLSSGNSLHRAASRLINEPFTTFLEKPYSSDQLVSVLCDMLIREIS